MSAQIIDGRKIAATLKEEVEFEVQAAASDGLRVGLATVSVGNHTATEAYLRRIDRIAAELGVSRSRIDLPATTTEAELVEVVHRLNDDLAVSGILMMRPLPSALREAAVFPELAPVKDIEALHPENAGLLALGTPRYVPSTAASIFHVLDSWLDEVGEERASFYHRSRIVVVGRSNNVGKPAISLAFAKQAAVTSIDEWASIGNALGSHTRRADVLIVAAGVPELIRAEHVRSGAVVLDVGINPVTDPTSGARRMVGDVALEEVATRARALTPVPGGIGPVTDVWLIHNTVMAARNAAMTGDDPVMHNLALFDWPGSWA